MHIQKASNGLWMLWGEREGGTEGGRELGNNKYTTMERHHVDQRKLRMFYSFAYQLLIYSEVLSVLNTVLTIF